MIILYKKINSCLHPLWNSKNLDTDAWNYSLERLPENIISTYSLILTLNKVPHALSMIPLKKVKTKNRYRSIF